MSIRDEDRVISETAAAPWLPDEVTVHPSVHDGFPGRSGDRHRTHERGAEPLVRNVLELREDEPQVGLVVTVPPGPPRRQHTGHAVECVDGEPGIVRDRGEP